MTYVPQTPREVFDAARFWLKVDRRAPNECWEWTASRNTTTGYGQFQCGGRVLHAHRYAYLLGHGEIPSGLFILHSCDNRWCVNPAHLRAGTQAENMHDKKVRRRARTVSKPGALNPAAKLTDDLVTEIRRVMDLGMTGTQVARQFGIDQTSASKIFLRKSWKHLP